MSIVRNIAGVAKGMSITFGEMFKPTEVENCPDGPGPNRGAHFQDRFRGAHVLQRDEMAWRSALPASCVRRPAPRTAFTSRGRTTPRRSASPAPSATRRSTTSTTTAASSAESVLRPALRMRSRTTRLRAGDLERDEPDLSQGRHAGRRWRYPAQPRRSLTRSSRTGRLESTGRPALRASGASCPGSLPLVVSRMVVWAITRTAVSRFTSITFRMGYVQG